MNSVIVYVLSLLMFVLPVCFSSRNIEWYESCGHNFTCGHFSVGFPFWGGSSRPKECGYPKLELTCEDVSKPVIEIGQMKFYVLEINTTSKFLRIAREDFYNGLCLQKFMNTPMDFKEFYYPSETRNITILYGCPNPSESDPGNYGDNSTFACRINGVEDTYSYYQSGATGPNGCYASVVVPGNILEIDRHISPSQIVRNGFKVNYKQVDATCGQCVTSKGRCGSDLSNGYATTCVCPDGSYGNTSCALKDSPHPGKGHIKLKIVVSACFSATVICLLIILLLYAKRKCSLEDLVSQRERKVDVEAFLRSHGSSGSKRYTYTDLKKITNSFKNKLGEGGYGSVYKGQLPNGNLVAVKMLHKSKGGTKDFINEVASIANTNHVNVIKLFGFCYEGHKRAFGFSYEGHKRALLYEFMPNGSLEKFRHTDNNHHSLGLETLFKIAIGVARGLEYLHRGCNTRILHFDIKPHNILLDENFYPKISDFGLAKCSPKKDTSILSMSEARGTIGYIAPEVFLKSFGGVSYKSDVYSYGMLVLEMVGCRRKAESELSSEQYFPEWIYKQLEEEEEINQDGILSSEELEMQKKMIVVSLWCVMTNPSSRPAMSKVVEMLEGTSELQIPPASTLSLSLPSSLISQS